MTSWLVSITLQIAVLWVRRLTPWPALAVVMWRLLLAVLRRLGILSLLVVATVLEATVLRRAIGALLLVFWLAIRGRWWGSIALMLLRVPAVAWLLLRLIVLVVAGLAAVLRSAIGLLGRVALVVPALLIVRVVARHLIACSHGQIGSLEVQIR